MRALEIFMKLKKILVVDDEKNLASQLVENFNNEGFLAKYIVNPIKIFEMIETFGPDVIVLDQMMPQRNGIDVLKDIRSDEVLCNIPIIMLSDSDSKAELLNSYKNGIDDFVVKPFDFEVLKARVRALCNRVSRTPSLIEFNNIQLCTKSCSVKIDGLDVKLTLTEFNLLKVLMNNKDEVLRREQLCQEVLGKAYSFSRSIDVHMLSLRNKLKDNASYIKTVRGVGYKLSP
jgi:two-component system alkaline phosphatase synthesis response regulator PhoP